MEPEVAPSPPQNRKLRVALYALPYLFILYVLSIGPMYWVIYEAYNLQGSRLVKYLYYPLVLASEIPYVAKFLDWYLSFWV